MQGNGLKLQRNEINRKINIAMQRTHATKVVLPR